MMEDGAHTAAFDAIRSLGSSLSPQSAALLSSSRSCDRRDSTYSNARPASRQSLSLRPAASSEGDASGAAAMAAAGPDPEAAPGQYVARDAYLYLKRQLVEERTVYLRECMALRHHILNLETSMRNAGVGTAEHVSSPTKAIAAAARRPTALEGQAEATSGAPGTQTLPRSANESLFASVVAADSPDALVNASFTEAMHSARGVRPLGVTFSERSPSPARGAVVPPVLSPVPAASLTPRPPRQSLFSPPGAQSQSVRGAPVPQPSVQLVPIERLAAAMASAATLREHDELHRRSLHEAKELHQVRVLALERTMRDRLADAAMALREAERHRAADRDLFEATKALFRVEAFRCAEDRLREAADRIASLEDSKRGLEDTLEQARGREAQLHRDLAAAEGALATAQIAASQTAQERAELRHALSVLQKKCAALEVASITGGFGSLSAGSCRAPRDGSPRRMTIRDLAFKPLTLEGSPLATPQLLTPAHAQQGTSPASPRTQSHAAVPVTPPANDFIAFSDPAPENATRRNTREGASDSDSISAFATFDDGPSGPSGGGGAAPASRHSSSCRSVDAFLATVKMQTDVMATTDSDQDEDGPAPGGPRAAGGGERDSTSSAGSGADGRAAQKAAPPAKHVPFFRRPVQR